MLPGTHALAETEEPSLPLAATGVPRGEALAWGSKPHPQALHVTGSAVGQTGGPATPAALLCRGAHDPRGARRGTCA